MHEPVLPISRIPGKKAQWFREAGITAGAAIPREQDHGEKPDEEETEEGDYDN
ncbi:hypothetical protein [Methanosarcina sp. UBA289]|uniref:hypothetical protein n=1 Tax=Methanosarcina sp. UBA289 TaxID=1915574 RepID=UPI0025EF1897|nr:hypothetical protein [Methanosarcina sp. UBA289]